MDQLGTQAASALRHRKATDLPIRFRTKDAPKARNRRCKKHLIRVILYLYVAITATAVLVILMITARQIRAARALLGWSRQELADKAIISLNALARLEGDKVDPRTSTLAAVERTLNRAGVEFLPVAADKGEGVRMASPDR